MSRGHGEWRAGSENQRKRREGNKGRQLGCEGGVAGGGGDDDGENRRRQGRVGGECEGKKYLP